MQAILVAVLDGVYGGLGFILALRVGRFCVALSYPTSSPICLIQAQIEPYPIAPLGRTDPGILANAFRLICQKPRV